MVERGNRITCVKCKTNYYDLGKRDKKCPRCGHSKGSKISNTNFLISLLPRKTKTTMILFIPVSLGKMDHYLS